MRRTVGYVRHLATSAGFLIAAACGGGDLVLPGDGAPAAITPVVGDGQTGTVGSPLADAIVVRVTDETGRLPQRWCNRQTLSRARARREHPC